MCVSLMDRLTPGFCQVQLSVCGVSGKALLFWWGAKDPNLGFQGISSRTPPSLLIESKLEDLALQNTDILMQEVL